MKMETKNTASATVAGSKFAMFLGRNVGKIITILAYILLEWALIILLLYNSFLAYLIRKFAAYFGLKPPCPWCSSVDHLLEPAHSADPFKSLVCEAHASEISNLAYCPNHKRLAASENMCQECLPSVSNCQENSTECSCCERTLSQMHRYTPCFPINGGSEIKEIEEEIDGIKECKATEGNINSGSESEHQVLSDIGSFNLIEAAEDSNEDEDTENIHFQEDGDCNDRQVRERSEEEAKITEEVQNEVAMTEPENPAERMKIENSNKEVESFPVDRADHLPLGADNKALSAEMSLHEDPVRQTECELDPSFSIQRLQSDLEAERKARNDLYTELEAERSAAAIAANQTMAMITRLQEEKAATQMEALQYQRVMEEQAEYDHEALQLLNELVFKREREKGELEKELELYRERASDYEAKEKAMMMIKKCENGNFSSPCSVDSDSDVLSIDLDRHYNKDEAGESSFCENENNGISLLDCSKEWSALDDSLEELEQERLAIIKQLKDLEAKLYQSEKEEAIHPTADLCSQEVNLVPSSFSANEISENHPKTMASVARKLLDLVESDDEAAEENVVISKNEMETRSKRLAIEKEMDHVYGRLQALEADTEFLRHCIGSVNKGSTGVHLLQEILQHLKELRAAEVCL